jgi:predicted NBD/HSP70 family sugar kinase
MMSSGVKSYHFSVRSDGLHGCGGRSCWESVSTRFAITLDLSAGTAPGVGLERNETADRLVMFQPSSRILHEMVQIGFGTSSLTAEHDL